MAIKPSPTPLYLAQRYYRQRRLRDAARILPIAGAVLWMLPMLYAAPQTSATGVYIFGVWVALIVLAAAVSRRLHPDDLQEDRLRGDEPET